MTYWSWQAGGAALAGAMFFHWLATGRLMAVSGRFTALVNRVRLGPDPGAPMSQSDLVAALRAATAEELGADAVAEAAAPGDEALRDPAPAPGLSEHALFLVALVVGGLASSLLAGRFHLVLGLAGSGFARLTHGSPLLGAIALVVGGAFVGFGTRMAGGCTSGHGMCGVSRFQAGSLVATAAFFGTGVATAFALGLLR